MLLYYSLAYALPFLAYTTAQTFPANLVGTWSTKSNMTHTGPGFYNPTADELIEPERTGISYSFTSDGFYEEAFYRALANPTDPACPGAFLQWQHGSYVVEASGGLTLTPIAVDGRQLMSQPCEGSHGVYTRYNQTEVFQGYAQYTDPYHNIPRLDLYMFNGAPQQPLYLVFNPPEMLPTTTLHPITATATPTASSRKAKREASFEPPEIPRQWRTKLQRQPKVMQIVSRVDPDRLWWLGLAMTGFGGMLYLGPRFLF